MKYGVELREPLTQTILPILNRVSNNILGVVPIARTVFEEPTYVFEFSTGLQVSVESVTLKHSLSTNRVEQYMCIALSDRQVRDRVYLGYPNLMTPDQFSYYFNVDNLIGQGQFTRMNLGMLTAFFYGMDKVDFGIDVDDKTKPEKAPAWNARMQLKDFENIQFFDFNWHNLFYQNHDKTEWVNPTIEVVANDSLFRVMLVDNVITRTVDTVRIIKTKSEIGIGRYQFQFKVSHAKKQPVIIDMNFAVIDNKKEEHKHG